MWFVSVYSSVLCVFIVVIVGLVFDVNDGLF